MSYTKDVKKWNGTIVATPDTAGYPVVTIKDGAGVGEINTSGGAVVSVTTVTGNVNGTVSSVTGAVGSVTAGVTVTTNNDKTGYSLTAGSYLIRAQSTQRGTITITSAAVTGTAAVSSTTVGRSHETYSGHTTSANANQDLVQTRVDLTNATTMTATRATQSGINAITAGFAVPEYF